MFFPIRFHGGEHTTPKLIRIVPVAVCFGLLLFAAFGAVIEQKPEGNTELLALAQPRVVILKARHELHLFDGDRLIRTYPIDLGDNPTGTKLRKDDRRTPEGRFRVVTKNAESPYHRFIGLNYPGVADADRGLATGLISPGEAASIRRADAAGACPNWSTELGGGIGIHGHKRGSDWTGGCVALSDAHVSELFSILRVGDTVEVLP